MQPMDNLTVCIPTYNRQDSIAARLKEFSTQNLNGLKVLVSDNSSEDSTLHVLSSTNFPGYSFLSNSGPPTFASNICNLLLNCETEWALMCSDEDTVLCENLQGYSNLLGDDAFDAVVGSYSSIETSPGKVLPPRNLTFREVMLSTYLGGILFRVDKFKNAINQIQANMDLNYFLALYPHTALLWLACALDKIRGNDSIIIRRGHHAKRFWNIVVKNKKDAKLQYFCTVSGRWDTWTGGREWLNIIQNSLLPDGHDVECLALMRKIHNRDLLPAIRAGIRDEAPDCIDAFQDCLEAEANLLTLTTKK